MKVPPISLVSLMFRDALSQVSDPCNQHFDFEYVTSTFKRREHVITKGLISLKCTSYNWPVLSTQKLLSTYKALKWNHQGISLTRLIKRFVILQLVISYEGLDSSLQHHFDWILDGPWTLRREIMIDVKTGRILDESMQSRSLASVESGHIVHQHPCISSSSS